MRRPGVIISGGGTGGHLYPALVVGRKLLRRIPLHRLHQISGVFFLILAAFALTKVF